MWAILAQSSPFSFKHLFPRIGHFLISSLESVAGSPSSAGKERSLGQSEINSSLRELRFWIPRNARDSRFWSLLMESQVRFLGRSRRSFSRKETTFEDAPEIRNALREVSLCKPQSDRWVWIFWQSSIWSDVRLGGKPPSGRDTRLGQLRTYRFWRDVRFCIWGGRDLRFPQFSIQSSLRLELGKPLCGKNSSPGQSTISTLMRCVRLSRYPLVFSDLGNSTSANIQVLHYCTTTALKLALKARSSKSQGI